MPILIVDDNEQNLKLARIALECEGFEVRTATDGESALEMLRTIHPRLILMDIQLPGLDGLEVTRRVKGNTATRDIVIIAVTAYAMKGDREKAMLAGCDGYITKPLDPIALPAQLGTYLGGVPVKRADPNRSNVVVEIATLAADDRAQILVIEDNPTTRKMFRVSLETAGYRVAEAHDGRAALAYLANHVPALIIQDLNLPDMHGIDLAHSMRTQLGDAAVPIVCVSGFLSRLDEARAAESGFAQVLVKPVDPQQLLDVAQVYLSEFRSTAAGHGLGRRVLIVDDDPLQRKLSQIWLTGVGFEVVEAEDGIAALALARATMPAIVVADVLMPKLDGFELCLALRSDAELAHIPVILCSAAYVGKADRELAFRVGASAMIAKIDGIETVLRAVTSALEAPAPPPPAEPIASLEAERGRRGLWQLERQVLQNTRLLHRTAQQQAQLAILAGVAESLTKQDLDRAVLGDALASCLDMAGISKGALYLADATGELALEHQIGFSASEEIRLRVVFDCQPLFGDIARGGQVVIVPSAQVADDIGARLTREVGTTGMLIVPVTRGSQVFGAMLLGARVEDIGGEDALAFARVLGAQMGQAIGLSRSFANLAASEHRYRTLTEHANDAIAIISLDGVIRESNRRLGEIVGRAPGELVGRHIRDFAAPGRARENEQSFRHRIATGAKRTPPVMLGRPDGSIALVEFSNATMNLGGEVVVLAIGRDVTEQLEAQTQLMVSDRMASVGTLAAGVAHEINNPLAAVVANVQLAVDDVASLAAKLGPSEELTSLQEVLVDASAAAERVRLIVKDLRIFSRGDDDRHRAVDVEDVLESTLRMAWNEIRHRAKLVRRFSTVAPVEASESRLGQVFLNLIINAAQAISEGHADRNSITITTSTNDRGHVVVEIRDTGPGIGPDELRKLFTPFFTTKPVGVGTGLGLAICHRIMTELGGEISVESEVGVGTAFRVTMPPTTRAKNAAIAPIAASQAPRRGRVLLVDDDPLIGNTVRRVLDPEHDVTTLTTARGGLDLIDAGERFDVILCDLMMPIMGGMEFFLAVAVGAPQQAERIVFLTGGAFTQAARSFLDEIENSRLEKPFHIESLRALVNERVR